MNYSSLLPLCVSPLLLSLFTFQYLMRWMNVVSKVSPGLRQRAVVVHLLLHDLSIITPPALIKEGLWCCV